MSAPMRPASSRAAAMASLWRPSAVRSGTTPWADSPTPTIATRAIGSAIGNRCEQRQGGSVGDRSECDRDAHPDVHGTRIAVDDIGHEPSTLVEVDQRDDVRDFGGERRRGRPMNDRAGVHRRQTGQPLPDEFVGLAVRASAAGIPDQPVAAPTTLEFEPALEGCRPEPSRIGIGLGESRDSGGLDTTWRSSAGHRLRLTRQPVARY